MDVILEGFVEAFKLIFSGNVEIYSIILLSLRVSLTSVVLASLVSIPLGIFLGLKNFKGRTILTRFIFTFMGMPPVVLGLFVLIALQRKGPLGHFRLYYSVTAMIIAQTLLVFPIILGNVFNNVKAHGEIIKDSCKTLGATRIQTLFVLIKELRSYIFIAIVTGFGRAISEVGSVMIAGGGIDGKTEVMTTYIAQVISMGDKSGAIAMALVLLTIAFIINWGLHSFVGDADD